MSITKKKIAIIGAGFVGTSIALELAKRGHHEVVVIEKEPVLGRHASGRNSGVIHSGINQKPSSFKARMCVEGSRLLREYCRSHNVPMRECGTLVISRNREEEAILERLLKMGSDCGVAGLRLMTAAAIKEREPLAQGTAGLLSPSGAVVESLKLLEALAEDAKARGVEFLFFSRVKEIDGQTIVLAEKQITAETIINCAGLYADKVAHRMGVGRNYFIVPFRGEYFEVKDCDVRAMIYPPPDLRYPFLSIHLTRETDGRVLAGPSAVLAFGREAYEKQWILPDMVEMFSTPQFLKLIANAEFLKLACNNAGTSFFKSEFLKQARTLVPNIQSEQLTPAKAGIRAQVVNADGKMEMDLLVLRENGNIHVLNAVSPGMTSCLSFACAIADELEQRETLKMERERKNA